MGEETDYFYISVENRPEPTMMLSDTGRNRFHHLSFAAYYFYIWTLSIWNAKAMQSSSPMISTNEAAVSSNGVLPLTAYCRGFLVLTRYEVAGPRQCT